MTNDWQAVGNALAERLDEQGMTMTELASRSGVSLTTVRELVHVLNTRRRQPRTLVALSEALGWPADHLGRVLRGRGDPQMSMDDNRAIKGLQEQIESLRADLNDVRERLAEVEGAQRSDS